MASDETTIRATGYLTIEPDWDGERLEGIRIVKVTRNRPLGGRYAVGSAIVKLSIDVPRRVFTPFEATAGIEATEGDVGVVRVVVEPFSPEPDHKEADGG